MITYYVVIIIAGILQLIALPISALPDVAFPTAMTSSLTSAGASLGVLNLVIPVATIFAIFTAWIAIELGIFTYKLIKWIYNKIPGVN